MDLKELLGEELYNQVMEKAGENKIDVVSNGNWFPKEKFDAVNKEKNDYKKQVTDRDKQLEDLKKVDAEGLQQKIQDLQQENETTKNEYESQLQQQSFDFALKDALTAAKVKNAKAVKALLDTDKLKLDGEKILGLDDQLAPLKESDGYLFEQEDQQQNTGKPSFLSGQHGSSGNSDEPTNLGDALAQHFSQNK